MADGAIAGWYDDGSGTQRWWDGQRWTEHVQARTAPAQQNAVPQQSSEAQPARAEVTEVAEEPQPVQAEVVEESHPARAEVTAEPQQEAAQTGPTYVVLHVALQEKIWGTESGNLTELEKAINQQAALGYRLHTITTTSSLGGDIQSTMVFERLA